MFENNMLLKAEISASVNFLEQRSEKTRPVALTDRLFSLTGCTKRYKTPPKNPYFCFHIIKVSPLYLSLSQRNQPTVTLSRHHTAFACERPRVTSRGQAAEPQTWGEKA